MFDGVYFCSVHHRFFVRGCHTDTDVVIRESPTGSLRDTYTPAEVLSDQ